MLLTTRLQVAMSDAKQASVVGVAEVKQDDKQNDKPVVPQLGLTTPAEYIGLNMIEKSNNSRLSFFLRKDLIQKNLEDFKSNEVSALLKLNDDPTGFFALDQLRLIVLMQKLKGLAQEGVIDILSALPCDSAKVQALIELMPLLKDVKFSIKELDSLLGKFSTDHYKYTVVLMLIRNMTGKDMCEQLLKHFSRSADKQVIKQLMACVEKCPTINFS